MVIAGIAIAGLAVGRTDAVTELGNLEGRPVELSQTRNQPGNHAGFPHAPRMPADYHDRHISIFSGFRGFKNLKLAEAPIVFLDALCPTIKP